MKNSRSMLTLIGMAIATMILSVLASCNHKEDTTREEFILCKIENTEAMIQYNSCISALYSEHWYEVHGNEHGTSSPNAGALAFPGGMITDPQPGGMITDSNSPKFMGFHPAPKTLEECAKVNILYRDAVEACGVALKRCLADMTDQGCAYPPPNTDIPAEESGS